MEVLFEDSISDGQIAETLNFPAYSVLESGIADLERTLFVGEVWDGCGVAAVAK
jgi:hypothetical protein